MNIVFRKYAFRIQEEGNLSFIFDIIRRKFVALTPEEWVRQHWIHYLIEEKKYPRSLFSLEKKIELNQLAKRCDIVIYNREGKPFLMIECKAPGVKISQKVFDQIARYNLTLKVRYLVVSNGSQHHCCEIDFKKKTFTFLESLPDLKL